MRCRRRTRSGSRNSVAMAAGVVLAVTTTACGTRLSHEQIVADHGASFVANTDALAAPPDDPNPSAITVPAAEVEPGAVIEVPTGSSDAASSPTAVTRVRPGTPAGAGGRPRAAADRPAPAIESESAPAPATGAKPAQRAQAGVGPPPAAEPAAAAECAPDAAQQPVKIGSIGAFSGILGQIIVPGLRGLQAWVSSINARGGLACHPVELLSADDGSDPARNQALHKQMVEQEGVVAFVYDSSPLGGPASQPYVESKQIPAIGNEGGGDLVYDSPMYFPQGAAGKEIFAMTVGAVAKAAPADRRKLAVVTCTEGSACTIAERGLVEGAGRVGIEVVYKGKASVTQPDFTAQCLAARNAGANLLIGTYTAEGQKRLARNCRGVGLDAVQAVTGIQATLDFVDEPALDGVIVAEAIAPWFDTGVPGVVEFRKSLQRSAPDVTADAGSITGWAAGKYLEAAVKAAPPAGPLTSAFILDGLYALKDDRLGGLTYPLNSTRGRKAERKACGWPVIIRGGQWKTAGEFFCI